MDKDLEKEIKKSLKWITKRWRKNPKEDVNALNVSLLLAIIDRLDNIALSLELSTQKVTSIEEILSSN